MSQFDDAFEKLYRKYYGRVCRTLELIGVPRERSSDLAQETFVRIYRSAGDRRDLGWRYVETVARRVAINDARWYGAAKRTGITIPVDDFDIPGWSDPARDLLQKEARTNLQTAIDALPSEASEALRLSLAGLTYDEISGVTATSTDAIKSRIKMARRLLQERVAASHPFLDKSDTPAIDALSDVDEILGSPIVSKPSLIFAAPAVPVHVGRLIVSVEDAMIEAIRREPRSIFHIPSRAFEQLLADIFRSKGFETELTKATRDGGRDIIAVHEVLGIKAKYIVECKRYALHRKVTLQLVQRLYGVKMAEGANKAILATTSSFTRDAVAFASHHFWDLELKSFDDVMAWIREYAKSSSSI